jgi:gluconokinase
VIIVIAGVSGSGKSTVGPLVAGRLRWPYADADTFHPSDNIEKMRAVKPLDDADRVPWLWAIGEWIDQRIEAGQPGVATCSALRRSYRDQLLADRDDDVSLVFLDVSPEVLIQRLASRPDHFFPDKLLNSQLETLEKPSPAERPGVRVINADGDPNEVAATIVAALWPYGDPGST